MSKIKIYGDKGSGSTRRVTALANHLGLSYEFIFIDVLKGETDGADFLKLNLTGRVPALVDGDVVLHEASAINIYLAEKTNSPLLPPSGVQRYEILKWMFWSGEHWRSYTGDLFEERLTKRILKIPASPENDAFILGSIRASARDLDAHLAKSKFLVGDQVTLADLDVAAPFSQIDRVKFPFREFSNIMRWHSDLLEAMPAWKETGKILDERGERDIMPLVR